MNSPNKTESPFPSFFVAGFECAFHHLLNGRRLGLAAATGQDRHLVQDYQRLHEQGLSIARDGKAVRRF